MRIPEVRVRLRQIADERGVDELHVLADQLVRRYHGRAARRVSEPVTDALADAVRAYRRAYPEQPEHKVAELFCLNQGRVSEILHGKRR